MFGRNVRGEMSAGVSGGYFTGKCTGGITGVARESRRRGGEDWGGDVPAGFGAVEPCRQRIFGVFEAHRTLLVERTVLLRPNKACFFPVIISTQSTIGACPPGYAPVAVGLEMFDR